MTLKNIFFAILTIFAILIVFPIYSHGCTAVHCTGWCRMSDGWMSDYVDHWVFLNFPCINTSERDPGYTEAGASLPGIVGLLKHSHSEVFISSTITCSFCLFQSWQYLPVHRNLLIYQHNSEWNSKISTLGDFQLSKSAAHLLNQVPL